MAETKQRRKRVSQTDVPRVPLAQALRVPTALAEQYGKEPARPLEIAAALEMSPTAGPFRELCGAAIGYGLTDGGPNAAQISLTDLGRRIVSPLEEGDDYAARRSAALTPIVEKKFLEKYDGSPLPVERIGKNVLESMGVPPDAASRVFGLVVQNARDVGFITTIKDKDYVDLGHRESPAERAEPPAEATHGEEPDEQDPVSTQAAAPLSTAIGEPERSVPRPANRRVFISHGKNKKVVEQLKELLNFGDFEPIVSVERQTTSKPVPDKVLDDMRGAGAGIIHVSPEEKVLTETGEERRVLNQNVLIEIGAAMALYGGRFVLLVEDGATLPSNLQGLYEVRYSGEDLGYEATMKVLKVLNEFKAA